MFEKEIKLKPKRYAELLESENRLNTLEANGVDNWEGYEGFDSEELTITINGTAYYIDAGAISYEDIVQYTKKDPQILYSVTFFHKESGSQGTLTPGEQIMVEDNTIFNIYFTGNA